MYPLTLLLMRTIYSWFQRCCIKGIQNTKWYYGNEIWRLHSLDTKYITAISSGKPKSLKYYHHVLIKVQWNRESIKKCTLYPDPTCGKDGRCSSQLLVDMIVGEKVSDSSGDFIPHTSNVCLFTQQCKARHGHLHTIYVNAPQVHQEYHLQIHHNKHIKKRKRMFVFYYDYMHHLTAGRFGSSYKSYQIM